jgi:hypothetical protein
MGDTSVRAEPTPTNARARPSATERLAAPVDGSSLAVFRIAFGLVVAWEVWRFVDHERIRRYYIEPEFLFTWWPFDWVKPWPGAGLYVHFAVLGVAALLLAVGRHYRLAATAVFLGITWIFLMEKARYLNHLYLVCLLAFLMIVLPAHRTWSVDAVRSDRVRSDTVPAWALWLLRFQVGVPYVLGGVAKINHDWLVRAEPLREWLHARTDFPLLGPLFVHEPVVRAMSVGSVVLDLLAPFLLLYRRTRVPAFAGVVAFHLLNARLFSIGIFPWMMILATTVFFPADWPRRMLADVRTSRLGAAAAGAGFVAGFAAGGWLPRTFSPVQALAGGVGVAILGWHAVRDRARPTQRPAPGSERVLATVPAALLAIWVAVQVLVPLRHFAYPGNVSWTEEGHRFAWHMKLRSKDAEARFMVTDPRTGAVRSVHPRRYLNDAQADEMSSRPDMIQQFALFLEDRLRAEPSHDLEVRAEVFASLNAGPVRLLVDPTVDLTAVPRPAFGPRTWVYRSPAAG